MSKNLSLITAATLALIMGGKAYFLHQENEQLKHSLATQKVQQENLALRLKVEQSQRQEEESMLKVKEAKISQEKTAEQQTLKNLEFSLIQEQTRILALKNKIEELRGKLEGARPQGSQNSNTAVPKAGPSSVRFQELEQRLSSYKAIEAELLQKNKGRLENLKTEEKAALAKLNEQIPQQKKILQQAVNKMKAWKKKYKETAHDPDYDKMNIEMNQQQTTLKRLENQKQAAIQTQLQDSEAEKKKFKEEHEALKEKETETEKTVNVLKEEIRKTSAPLPQKKPGTAKENVAKRSQIQDLVKSYRFEQQKARELEKQIFKARAELQK